MVKSVDRRPDELSESSPEQLRSHAARSAFLMWESRERKRERK